MGKYYQPQGRKMEGKGLSFIEERLISESKTITEQVLRMTKEEYRIPMSTLRRWYTHFLFLSTYLSSIEQETKLFTQMVPGYLFIQRKFVNIPR